MPLKVDFLGPGWKAYSIQEDLDGRANGRLVPEILDQRKGDILALIIEQVRQYCSEFSLPEVDTSHLFRAADELVGNAMRAGNGGNPRKAIKVDCILEPLTSGIQARFIIEDEGPGIPLEVWNRDESAIFSSYEKGEIKEGGWGLIILKGIAELQRIGRGNIVQAIVRLPIVLPTCKSKPEGRSSHGGMA